MFRKLVMMFLIFAVILYPFRPQSTHAAAGVDDLLIIGGSMEIGTLALWGGCVLVGSGVVIAGGDEETAQRIKDFGKAAWNDANDSIKASISNSLSVMATATDSTKKYSVTWSSDVYSYLQSKFNSFWSTRPVTKVPTGTIDVGNASEYGVRTEHYQNGSVWENFVMLEGMHSYQTQSMYMQRTVYTPSTPYLPGEDSRWTYKIRVTAASPDFRYIYGSDGLPYAASGSTYPGVYVDMYLDGTKFNTGYEGPVSGSYLLKVAMAGVASQYLPVFPDNFPRTVSIPAPRGYVDSSGAVAVSNPNIGRIGATGEIGIGYTGELTAADSITATVSEPVPADPPAEESGKLNLKPLLMVGSVFTTKFPFSIPWDIKNQFNVFNVDPKPAVLKVDKDIPVFGTHVALKFNIDFTMFEPVAAITRWFLIIAFDLGMILSIRKFMPE